MTTNATSTLSCVRHNSVPCNCVQLCYIYNDKLYTDQKKSSLCFIPSSHLIIGDSKVKRTRSQLPQTNLLLFQIDQQILFLNTSQRMYYSLSLESGKFWGNFTMFPHNKSVHHCILCIAEQIQLMTKTTQGPVITASHISVKLKHLFVFWVKNIFRYLITNCLHPNISSILIIMMEIIQF
jgi:hypothetical protein